VSAANVGEGRLRAARIVEPESHRPLYVSHARDRGYNSLAEVGGTEIVSVAERLKEQGIWR
jgi:hypothetical protein